jgi:hypothetical protein
MQRLQGRLHLPEEGTRDCHCNLPRKLATGAGGAWRRGGSARQRWRHCVQGNLLLDSGP